jgi:hypothetical protein
MRDATFISRDDQNSESPSQFVEDGPRSRPKKLVDDRSYRSPVHAKGISKNN